MMCLKAFDEIHSWSFESQVSLKSFTLGPSLKWRCDDGICNLHSPNYLELPEPPRVGAPRRCREAPKKATGRAS